MHDAFVFLCAFVFMLACFNMHVVFIFVCVGVIYSCLSIGVSICMCMH